MLELKFVFDVKAARMMVYGILYKQTEGREGKVECLH